MHLVDTTMFFCARSGGVKRYLMAKHAWLARRAPQIKHSLLVPTPQRRQTYVHTVDALALRLKDGYRLPLALRAWCDRLAALEPDVIEAGDPYVPGWAARVLGRSRSLPIVAFYHSDMPRMLAQRVGRWIAPVSRAYLRQLYDGFDLVLAPSRSTYEQLVNAGIRRVRLQPLGVDVGAFAPTRADPDLRTRLCLDADTRLLVYAGRLAAEKNLSLLMQAAQRLGSPYHLLIIGARSNERIASNITLLPYQRSAERLASLLASCDAFVHAGDSETYGLVAVEAMACGLPVIAGAGGALGELVDVEVGCLVDRFTADAFAAAIEHVFERDRHELSFAARARALTQHSWDAVLPRLLHHYAALAPRPAAAIMASIEQST